MNGKHSLRKYLVLIGIVAAGSLVSLLTAPSARKTRVQWPVMGTVAVLTFRGGTPEEQERMRAGTRALWDALEDRLSAWRTDSELARFAPDLVTRGTAALDAVPADVRPCYAFAFDLKHLSGGAFDPVVGDTLQRLGFTRRTPVDLGAVAKGFAVDAAYAALPEADVLLDLGGNLRARGGTWHTGVRNPFQSGALAASFDLRSGEAVATSGNYERFVERDGLRLSHILDARTGEPVAGIAGVTVVADTALKADGLSTTLFVLGPEAGMAFLKKHYPGTAALWIPDAPERPEIRANVAMAVRLKDVTFALTVLH